MTLKCVRPPLSPVSPLIYLPQTYIMFRCSIRIISESHIMYNCRPLTFPQLIFPLLCLLCYLVSTCAVHFGYSNLILSHMQVRTRLFFQSIG